MASPTPEEAPVNQTTLFLKYILAFIFYFCSANLVKILLYKNIMYSKLVLLLLIPFLMITMLFAQDRAVDETFVFIQGGAFFMGNNAGDPDEVPVRKVRLKDFYVGRYEVTNSEYCAFLNRKKPSRDSLGLYIDLDGKWQAINCKISYEKDVYVIEEGFEDHPVIFVSWYGADAYCRFYGYRLPSEAEWEYAAKGGKTNYRDRIIKKFYDTFSGGNDPSRLTWYRLNSNQTVHPVGQKHANMAGTYDMSGNVDEWCNDWYSEDYYAKGEKKDPKGPQKSDFKVHRGGSWYNSEKMLKVTNRRATNPKSQKATIGFRVAKDISE
jgi:formylglycine-generating enzyme required for sulfatase activity